MKKRTKILLATAIIIPAFLISTTNAAFTLSTIENTSIDSIATNDNSIDSSLQGFTVESEVLPTDSTKITDSYQEVLDNREIVVPDTLVESPTKIVIPNTDIENIIKEVVPVKNITITKINNLNISNNIVNFYLYSPSDNKITSIVINTNAGTETITLNKEIDPGLYSILINRGNDLIISKDGKKILTQKINNLGLTYSSLSINTDKTLYFSQFKVFYVGSDYIENQNQKIDTVTTSSNVKTKDNIISFEGSDLKLIKTNKKEEFTWDPVNKKFNVTETVNSQENVNIFIPTSLKSYLKSDINPLLAYIDLNSMFDSSKVTLIKNIEIDGDTNTKEFLIKLNDVNEYFLGRIEVKKVIIGTNTSYNTYITKLYKSKIDLTNLTPIELDGISTTKEFYLKNGIYTSLFQYIDGNFNRIMNEKFIKVYFSNLLDKTGTTWKVLFSLATSEVADGGKYYVEPLFKLYWYDPVKKIYFMKQTKDLTDYTTLNLKIDGVTIYSKTNGTVDKTNTDFIQ